MDDHGLASRETCVTEFRNTIHSETAATEESLSQPTKWLTPSDAAQYLSVKVRTVLLWARQGKLRGYVLSGLKRHAWRFRQADLDDAFVESDVVPSQSPSVRPAERMEE
jgi:excisionase family DNA binding protein